MLLIKLIRIDKKVNVMVNYFPHNLLVFEYNEFNYHIEYVYTKVFE